MESEPNKIIDPSKRILRNFELARRVANQSSYGKFRHGAVLINGGSVINVAHNKNNTCSFGARFRNPNAGRATLHAELGCILNVEKDGTRNGDVYVVRINPAGQLKNSKPCPMCQEAMRFVGIKRCYYSTDFNTFEMVKL
jgi:tRNA(Arg) A34 adenosine deaminase TadA